MKFRKDIWAEYMSQRVINKLTQSEPTHNRRCSRKEFHITEESNGKEGIETHKDPALIQNGQAWTHAFLI